jgi:hypothetical protein
MRMQALDSDARATNTAEGSGASVGRIDRGIAFGCITNVCFIESRWADVGFGLIDTATCFKSSNNYCLTLAQQPITRWHWCAVIKKWRVAQYDRVTTFSANNDFELSLGYATQKFADSGNVSGIHGLQKFNCGNYNRNEYDNSGYRTLE